MHRSAADVTMTDPRPRTPSFVPLSGFKYDITDFRVSLWTENLSTVLIPSHHQLTTFRVLGRHRKGVTEDSGNGLLNSNTSRIAGSLLDGSHGLRSWRSLPKEKCDIKLRNKRSKAESHRFKKRTLASDVRERTNRSRCHLWSGKGVVGSASL